MPQLNKWFDRLPAKVTEQAALRKLWRQRYEALAYYLNRLGKEKSPAVETIHQMRVWARRTTAVLDLFAPPVHSSEWAKLRKSLKKIRRWAGEVRDYDVLWVRMQQADPPLDDELLSLWKRRRRLARKRFSEKFHDKSLLHAGAKVLKQDAKEILQLDDSTAKRSFKNMVYRKLRSIVRVWLKQAQADLKDPHELHQFRIEGKRLRYALEISSSVMPAEKVRQVYDVLTALHEQLGQICDIRAAVERYSQLREEVPPAVGKSLTALIRRERQALSRQMNSFLRQWTPEAQQAWASLLNQLLKP